MIVTDETDRQLRARGLRPLQGPVEETEAHVQVLVAYSVPVYAPTRSRWRWIPAWACPLIDDLRPLMSSGEDLLVRRAVEDAARVPDPRGQADRARELVSAALLGGAEALEGALAAKTLAVVLSAPQGRPRARPRRVRRRRLFV